MTSAFLYSAFGFCIESELELPGLPPGAGEPDVIFRLGPVASPGGKANADEHVLFNRIAGGFRMNRGQEITVDPLPHADAEGVRLVLLGKAMAALLRQRGWLPLHSSGVAIDGRAVLFLGPSGAGKSTAAAALHARGHGFVTDDVGAVQTVNRLCTVRSGLSRIRLSDMSIPVLEGRYHDPVRQIDKYNLRLNQADVPPTLPVCRIYILDFGAGLPANGLRVEELSPLLGTASLNMHSFFPRGTFEMDCVRLQVQACAALADAMPICQITRPRSFPALPDLVRMVEQDVAAG